MIQFALTTIFSSRRCTGKPGAPGAAGAAGPDAGHNAWTSKRVLTPKKGWDFTTYDIGAEPFQVRTWYELALKYIVLNPPKDTPRTDIS